MPALGLKHGGPHPERYPDMPDDVTALRERFDGLPRLDQRVDEAFRLLRDLGFEGLIYDYSPIARAPDGGMVAPSLLELRNVDQDMRSYWYDHGYFRLDPVQRIALGTSVPFHWSYDTHDRTVITPLLDEETAPVTCFLRERGLSSGVTVPLHLPRGDFATVTGVGLGGGAAGRRDALHAMAELSLTAALFHDSAFSLFDEKILTARMPCLTPRERECLRHSAQGLSAKEISRLIDRSVPTVVMHLNAAIRKLGARNRVHAVSVASHFRLI